MNQSLAYIIESLLFVSDDPLGMDALKKALPDQTEKDIEAAIQTLEKEYDVRGGGFHLIRVAGGYQLRTRSDHAEWIRRLVQPEPRRLSRAALETLAVVAYKQPVIRSDVEHIRGVDCGGVLRALLEKQLIRILGRKEVPGRPMIYATTRLFLEVFGLDSLKDLPTPEEIQELGGAEPDTADVRPETSNETKNDA